jgi:hypothetical protein
MKANYQVIADACALVQQGAIRDARQTLESDLAFERIAPVKRQYTHYQSVRIFLRDGFVDRYSGDRLVFPPVLRILSKLLPKAFPFHPNWKMSECHIAYWQLFPTIDHVIPVARGGVDEESKWVCTSQLRNSAKANWLLDEIGWQLREPGDLKDWDGLTEWFAAYVGEHAELLKEPYVASWHRALRKARPN